LDFNQLRLKHPRQSADAKFFNKIGKNLPQFWESEATVPYFEGASPQAEAALRRTFDYSIADCLAHPFRTLESIRQQQFERLRQLVAIAFHEIPVYAEKYRHAGFAPEDLRSWEDFERLPVITKDELIAAYPDGCVSRRWPTQDLFCTRSSGSSGKTLLIRVDLDAILTDTVQGVRQYWLQSGMKYNRDHVAALIYTLPWWFEAVGDDFPTVFISGLIAPDAVATILDDLKPQVISCYPTNLKGLMPYWDCFDRRNLNVVVVHSETSTERRQWSAELGVPVLDEYSSEEATRIALELPCGHYHVCEDTVYLEALDPRTGKSAGAGASGLAVVTNLLNQAMPFIRYVQGDYVTRASAPESCLLGWSQLASIDGRRNDSFVNRDGREIPAGTILDVTYRWMFDVGIHLREFELVQKTPDTVTATFMVGTGPTDLRKIEESLHHLTRLLEGCLGHRIKLHSDVVTKFPDRSGKRRPIRRVFPSEGDVRILH